PVQSRRRRGAGVTTAELAGQHVDLLYCGLHAAQLHGQCVRRVVAGVHEQPVQQLVDRVAATGRDAHLGALGGDVVGGAVHGLVEVEFVKRLHRDKYFDDTGRAVPAVRIAGGDDGTAIQVG